MQENKLTIRGELSLLLVIIINSLGVVLMLHSGSGISAFPVCLTPLPMYCRL